MNIDRIIDAVEIKYSDRYVAQIYEYQRKYLVCAPHKDIVGVDYSDPFFIIDADGNIEAFLPIANIKLFDKFRKNSVYENDLNL